MNYFPGRDKKSFGVYLFNLVIHKESEGVTKSKNKGGSKGKYHEWLTDDGLLMLESWARDGLTDEQIATNIGVRRETLYGWKNRFPNIDNAIKRGKAPVDIQVENALLKRALGYEYEETKIIVEKTGDGEPKTRQEKTMKQVPPDTGAAVFWLKNRKPDVWRKMSPEYKAKIEAETRKLELETKEIEQQISFIEDIADDGFIDALRAEVDDVWQNKDD